MRILPISTNYSASMVNKNSRSNNYQPSFQAWRKEGKPLLALGVAAGLVFGVSSLVNMCTKQSKHNDLKEFLHSHFQSSDNSKKAELERTVDYYDYLMKTYDSEEEIKFLLHKYTSPYSDGESKITHDEKIEIARALASKPDVNGAISTICSK